MKPFTHTIHKQIIFSLSIFIIFFSVECDAQFKDDFNTPSLAIDSLALNG
jgi:hypothetical protein